jgi:site-specific DNA-methyltransferase (adenine-specific)
MNRILHGDNLTLLPTLPNASAHLIYIDPPFNTGTTQARPRLKTVRDEAGDRTGFGGHRYRTERVTAATPQYTDHFDDFLAFLKPRLEQAHRILTPHGSLFFHIDPREVHYCKVLLDRLRRPIHQTLARQA